MTSWQSPETLGSTFYAPPLVNAWRQQADEIIQQYGAFVLVNTDVSATNSKYYSLEHYRKVLVQIGWLDPGSNDDCRLLDYHLSNDRSNMEAISAFARAMCNAMPEQKIVLRPHPTEDDRRWRELAGEIRNLSVITDTEPVPWLLATRCLIHTGCTTGVEAVVLGTPSVSLVTDEADNPFSSFRLSNAVGCRVTAIEDAVDAARAFLSTASFQKPVKC